MAIPDSPLTRSEEYLNNIATGEGAIPDVPLTRIEQYLDYIAKNGGSGGGGSGGGGAVYAMLTQDAETEVWSCDKTYAELKEAYDAGSIIVADVYSHSEWYGTSPMVFKRNGDLGAFAARLVYAISSNGKVGFIGRVSVVFISDETIQVREFRTNNLDT